MDWTLEDKMVGELFFRAALISRETSPICAGGETSTSCDVCSLNYVFKNSTCFKTKAMENK